MSAIQDEADRTNKVSLLLGRIYAFLGTRIGSDGGWPDVPDDIMNELHDIFCEIRDLKIDLDEDGDAVLVIDMHNRSYGHKPWVPVFPHLHKTEEDGGVSAEEKVRAWMTGITALTATASERLRELERGLKRLTDQIVEEKFQKAQAELWKPGSELPKSSMTGYIVYWKLEPFQSAVRPDHPKNGELRRVRYQKVAFFSRKNGHWKVSGSDEIVEPDHVYGWRDIDDLPEHLEPPKQQK